MVATINADTTSGVIITSDTSGEIELQADGVTKAKITANGLQDANGASLRGGMYRNLIINGDMQIAQRTTSSTGVTSGESLHTVDRWKVGISNAGTWDITQSTDVPTGQGFGNSLKLDCTTADASLTASDRVRFYQLIEAQNCLGLKNGTSNAEKTTLSFWVKSNKTGTYTVSLYKGDSTARANGLTYTISSADTWEKKTLTFDGDTTGGGIANDNGDGLHVYWYLAVGPNYTSGTFYNGTWGNYVQGDWVSSSQVNLADSTSNYINITGVQLEVGSGASDFEFLPYDVQLARCQRYYEKSYNDGTALGTATTTGAQGAQGAQGQTTTTAVGSYVNFVTQKRTTPTITSYDSAGASGKIDRVAFGAAVNTGNTANIYESGDKGFIGYSASGTAAHSIRMHYTADAEL